MPEPARRDVPPADLARFRAAEDRLYPLAMTDPERYQRGVTLCGLLLDDLRASCPDVDAVLRRLPALTERLRARADAAGIRLDGLDEQTVVDAACAVRCRELAQDAARSDEQARVAAASDAGDAWLVEEADPAAVLAGFYRRVEVHLPTGTRMVTSMEVGGGDQPISYRLEVVPGPSAAGSPGPTSEMFVDRDDWVRAADRRRAEISRVY
jgi:hypothetical protein